MKPSYGDGRYMTVAEAVERRRRMIARFKSVFTARIVARVAQLNRRRPRMAPQQNRDWAASHCYVTQCHRRAPDPDDLIAANADGTHPLAICSECRSRRLAA